MDDTESGEMIPRCISNKHYLQDIDFTDNGLYLQSIYIPEEIVQYILSFIDSKELLKYSRVCRKWNKLIKSYSMWSIIYTRKYSTKIKKLPWYLYYCYLTTNYFDNNLIQNGNGQDQFEHWKIKGKGGLSFTIENPPKFSAPLPLNVPEFYNQTSCFATSSFTCHKTQRFDVAKNKLFHFIVRNYKPHIYMSEWAACRYDCHSVYRLYCGFENKRAIIGVTPTVICLKPDLKDTEWRKVEMTVIEYPDDFDAIVFGHSGNDVAQYGHGHYGCKMAGGVLKFLFDSITVLPTDESETTLFS